MKRRGPRAFTLIELLAAVGITALLAGIIIAIVSNVSSLWSRSSGRLSAEAQARYVLDQLSLDLSSALFRDDGNVWLAATIPANTNNTLGLWNTSNPATTSGNLKPVNTAGVGAGSLQAIATGNLADNSLTSPRFGVAGVWLRFFTAKRGSNTTAITTSAPVAVGYQIVRRATSTAPRATDVRYLLHRVEVRPTAASATRQGTLESGYNITSAAYAPVRNTAQTGDPAEIRFPTINSVVAENVIDFGVRFHVRDATSPTGLRLVFPTTNSTSSYQAKTPSSVAGATDAFPDVVDVMVRILTDDGARLIARYEGSPAMPAAPPTGRTAQQYWWDLVLANSQVFTRRIVVNAKSL